MRLSHTYSYTVVEGDIYVNSFVNVTLINEKRVEDRETGKVDLLSGQTKKNISLIIVIYYIQMTRRHFINTKDLIPLLLGNNEDF